MCASVCYMEYQPTHKFVVWCSCATSIAAQFHCLASASVVACSRPTMDHSYLGHRYLRHVPTQPWTVTFPQGPEAALSPLFMRPLCAQCLMLPGMNQKHNHSTCQHHDGTWGTSYQTSTQEASSGHPGPSVGDTSNRTLPLWSIVIIPCLCFSF